MMIFFRNIIYCIIILTQTVRAFDIFDTKLHNVVSEKPSEAYQHTLRVNFKNHNGGFFSWFKGIIGSLEYFDRNATFTDMQIELTGGPYQDQDQNQNWWNNYFEPIIAKKKSTEKKQLSCVSVLPSEHLIGLSFAACNKKFSRERAYYLINKYIKLKNFVQEIIDDIIESEFTGYYVIGIHYRGTDKAQEAPHVQYEAIYNQIKRIIKDINKPCKIFIATDEQTFLDDIRTKFTSVFALDIIRSTNGTPLHLGKQPVSPYQRGLEALLDCVLLSRTNILIIKTQSNLSSSASDFNPTIPLILLNNPFHNLR